MADAELHHLAGVLRDSGVRRVHSFAWRDLDDPDAGGSEVHADEILSRWAAAGLEVVHRTSSYDIPRSFERNGYQVEQAGGRISVLARSPWHGMVHDRRQADAVVDIWNGLPWWSPVWFRGPRVTWLHHLHTEMWAQSFQRHWAVAGRFTEGHVAPFVYRRERIVTLSPSSRDSLVRHGFRAEQVDVVAPGIDPMFRPDESVRSTAPLVVAVGRLAPVKRYLDLAAAVQHARAAHPSLTLEIVGDGPERPAIEAWRDAHGAAGWMVLRGRIDDEELVRTYQRAWVAASASLAEGWGMALTEAAACGTPSVATDIAGHRDAVADGRSGLLVRDVGRLGEVLAGLLAQPSRLAELRDGAMGRAAELTWDRAAIGHLRVLAAEVARRR